MRGCSVFTRPPSSSGTSVSSSTCVDLEPVLLEVRRRAAARDELDTRAPASPRAKSSRPVLSQTEISARSRDQLAHDLAGSSRCSTAWMRARASRRCRGSTGTALLRGSGPRVDALVHVVDGHAGLGDAGRERVLDRARPRERGQQRGVDVDDPAGEAVEEGGVSRCM